MRTWVALVLKRARARRAVHPHTHIYIHIHATRTWTAHHIARCAACLEAPTRIEAKRMEEVGGRRKEEEENKLERVRGGCLGAQDRRRTRRPAKRSGGAACKRRALRFRMGQPLQSDVWRPVGEHIAHRGAAGELKHLSNPTKRNQKRFPQ